MKISRLIAPRTSRVEEIPTPRPEPGQVLLEVVACGVCTSDLDVWRKGPGDRRPTELGHEVVGKVAAVGSADSRWREGELVTGLGGPGFATHLVTEERVLLPVPHGIRPEHAIAEPIATLEEAIARCAPATGARVAVVGLGFMGLGLVQLALARAPREVIGVDPSPAARQRALALGCSVALHPDEVAGYLGKEHDRRADLVIEATGVTPGLETASPLVAPFGTLCVVGYHHAGTAGFDMELWYKGATIVNGFCPDRGRVMCAMDDALGLVARRRFSYAPLITHSFALDQVDAAYELMDARDPSFVKGVILP
jgi:(R,R)-butanediol dehydrogenase/meso-butanediol dehydrogenase/diacetyl reductase